MVRKTCASHQFGGEVKNVPAKCNWVTVRIHVPKAFVSKEQWALWCSRPGSMLQDWSPQTKAVHTSYGWVNTSQKNWHGSLEEFVCGYAKVEAHNVQTVLDRSGRSGAFACRLAKECARVHVEWVGKGNFDDASYLNKVTTVAAAQKLRFAGVLAEVIVWDIAWLNGPLRGLLACGVLRVCPLVGTTCSKF